MLAAMGSGSGKTVITCGLLAALKKRGLSVRAFKCGPDYIDPMLHTRVLGVPSRNLDLFLQGEEGARGTVSRQSGDIAVIEAAMGFYDGAGGTETASAWQTADALGVPVVLVLQPKGASLTLAAQVRGMQGFREPSHIAGLLLNGCKETLYRHLAPVLERETGLPVLGYLPHMEQAVLESRHLGLLTAGEVADLAQRFDAIAEQMEKTVDISVLLALAGELGSGEIQCGHAAPQCTIAVARDEAFCFCYDDNLDRLRESGAETVFFSPLYDEELPTQADGLYLVGGYPELYADSLEKNASMRESIRGAVLGGLPTVAECGGFLYLQQTLEDEAGVPHAMAGVLPGAGYRTGRLQRFGYLTLTAESDSLLFGKGDSVPAHEFHYWDSTENGTSLSAKKPVSERSWSCGFTSPELYAAFPHLYFNEKMARRFADRAAQRKKEHT